MPKPSSLTQRVSCLLGLSLLLGLTVPAHANPPDGTQDKTEAAKVAKKVEKAGHRALEQTKEEVEALAKFQTELNRYENLHNDLIKRLSIDGPVTGGDLARSLLTSRSEAKPGDILISEVRPLFRRLIAGELKGADTFAARKALAENDPAGDKDVVVVMRVNAPYPTGAARSTVPPSLLLSLPVLPECLHYRFVGRDLILIDAVAQVIVDFLPVAAPATSTSPR